LLLVSTEEAFSLLEALAASAPRLPVVVVVVGGGGEVRAFELEVPPRVVGGAGALLELELGALLGGG